MAYKISDSEWKIMEIIWEKGAVPQSDIMDALNGKWNKNTVYTFLSRLEQKGLVAAEGTPKEYRAAVSRGDCVAQEEENFLNKIYHGSAGKMVTAFLQEGRLSADEVEELKKLLEGMDV